jgi:hypothetical protein
MTTPANSADALKRQLDAYKIQLASVQASLKAAQASLALMKKKKATKSLGVQIARQSAIIKQLSSKQSALGTKVSDTQNKYYSESGQYEQLLKGTDRDAYMAINSLFKSYGLESLAPKIFDYVKNGYSPDTVSILLQDTTEYKQRFAGNEIRKQQGLPVLNPGEYLATEASYKQIMQASGMPTGFYDQNSDFNNWIGKNISPSEIQTRVDLATQATTLSNPSYRKALNAMGISDNELTAYFLDSTRALPHLQKSAATAAVGAEALQQGLTFDKSYSEQLAMEGISADQARQGYSQVASDLATYGALGKMYGQDFGQRTAEQSVFENDTAATAKKNRLFSQERAAFTGGTGGARGGLGQEGGAR